MQTRLHVCVCMRAHVLGVGIKQKPCRQKQRCSERRALMMTGVMAKALRGIAPGTTSHVRWDKMEYMNVVNKQ